MWVAMQSVEDIDQVGGLYGRILTTVVKIQTKHSEVSITTKAKIFLYQPSSVNSIFIIWAMSRKKGPDDKIFQF